MKKNTRRTLSLLLVVCMLSITALAAPGTVAGTAFGNKTPITYKLSNNYVNVQDYTYIAKGEEYDFETGLYSDVTHTVKVYMVPVGTVITTDRAQESLITYIRAKNTLGTIISAKHEFTVPDATTYYQVNTATDYSPIADDDEGIWVKGVALNLPTTSTGETVSEWALPEVNKAIEKSLIPAYLKGTNLTETITRREFAATAVTLYERMSGKTAIVGTNPFTDTTDAEVLKAYNLGIVEGIGDNLFAPGNPMTREEASTMLARVYTTLGGTIAASTVQFTDHSTISSWAKASVCFMSEKSILQGIGNNSFSPKTYIDRQSALLISLRMFEKLK